MSPLAVRVHNFLRWFFDCSPTPVDEPLWIPEERL